MGAYDPHYDVKMESRCSSGTPPPPTGKPSVYCEIVIPAIHTSDRPALAKSKSETSVNRLHCECVLYVCACIV